MNSVRPVVLVGVDGSTADDIAIDWGVQEASIRGLPLRILHVASAPWLPQTISTDLADLVLARSGAVAAELVDRASERVLALHPGLEVDQRILPGQIVEQLVKAASTASVLVLGSGQRFDPSRLALGSVAVHVTAHALCPVIVTRTPAAGEPTTGPSAGRVVVGVDGSKTSAAAVGFAFDEASRRGLGLTAVHAYPQLPDEWLSDAHDPAEYGRAAARVLAESLAGRTEDYPDVEVVSRLTDRGPVQALVEESAGAALLVVGSHGYGRFAGMLLGSVSQAMLRHSSVSVAVVR
jgi:nucleotide-binding universal stress UspA family protein